MRKTEVCTAHDGPGIHSAAHEFHDILHVVCVGKHVHRLHGLHTVGTVQKRQVAGLRSRIAAHVDDPPGCGTQDDLDDRLIDSRTGRVEDNDVGTAVRLDERSSSTSFMSPA